MGVLGDNLKDHNINKIRFLADFDPSLVGLSIDILC